MQKPRQALENATSVFLQMKGDTWEEAEKKIRAIREATKKTSMQIARENTLKGVV